MKTSSLASQRLAALIALVLGGLSLSFLLPKKPPMRDCAIAMKLPEQVGFWRGVPREPSKEERAKLAEDTTFEKKDYYLLGPVSDTSLVGPMHRVGASIVRSGQDLNSSIHRPERCLPAQGFKELRGEQITVEIDGRRLPVMRLRCFTEHTDPETGAPIALPSGERLRIEHVMYYWFVGSHTATADHFERTFTDMKDRLLGGYNQHWAYVLLSAAFTRPLVERGLPLGDHVYPQGRSEQETDILLTEMVQAISRSAMDWEQITP